MNPTMNYEEIYEKWEELPSCRIYINLGEGGERCWGRELPDGTYGIDNFPLNWPLQFQDIVKTREVRDINERLHFWIIVQWRLEGQRRNCPGA